MSTWLSVGLPAAFFAYVGYERRWAGDDGFINLRVVSQLLRGNGFVYNAGERVEAVTSAAWIFVLSLFGALGANIETAAWVVALSLSVLGVVLAALASARTWEREGAQLTLPLGVLAYCAIPVAWEYATSALENGLGLAFLGGVYWAMTRPTPSPRVPLLLGLAPLVRPDFALYALPLLAVDLLDEETWGERVKVVAVFALPGGAYELFRMGYFAAIVPNTALAKSAFDANWHQGWLYFTNTFGTYQLLYPLVVCMLAIALLARSWQRARVPLALVLGALMHVLYILRVGGDFMHGRVLLPPLFALLSAGGAVRVRLVRDELVAGLVACAVVLGWGVYCARSLRAPYYADGMLDEHRWRTDNAGEPNPVHAAQYEKHPFYKMSQEAKEQIAAGCPHGLASLKNSSKDRCRRVAWLLDDSPGGIISDHARHDLLPLDPLKAPRDVVGIYAFRPLGVSGRMMGLRINIVDAYGLADPHASRSELLQRGRPGHEKELSVVWFVAKYASPGATNDPRVATAKQALRCGLLHELHDATRDPMTITRFLRNVWFAIPLHGLRIPEDPKVAVARFCRV